MSTDLRLIEMDLKDPKHQVLTLYQSFGFGKGEYDAQAGTVLFRQKSL
jgi:hypothetical protein